MERISFYDQISRNRRDSILLILVVLVFMIALISIIGTVYSQRAASFLDNCLDNNAGSHFCFV